MRIIIKCLLYKKYTYQINLNQVAYCTSLPLGKIWENPVCFYSTKVLFVPVANYNYDSSNIVWIIE